MTRIYVLVDPDGRPGDGWRRSTPPSASASEYEALSDEVHKSINGPNGLMAGLMADPGHDLSDLVQMAIRFLRSLRPEDQPPDQNLTSTSLAKSPKVAGQGRPSRTTGDELFDRFWAAYPRKVKKLLARRTFDRVVRTFDPEEVIEAARTFGLDPNLPESIWIPHPSSWLSAGSWADGPLPQRHPNGNGSGATQRPQRDIGVRLPVDDIT